MNAIPIIILTGLFNFDQYLDVFRILFYQVLPVVLVILTIYTIWGIINDMKGEESDKEYERSERLREV